MCNFITYSVHCHYISIVSITLPIFWRYYRETSELNIWRLANLKSFWAYIKPILFLFHYIPFSEENPFTLRFFHSFRLIAKCTLNCSIVMECNRLAYFLYDIDSFEIAIKPSLAVKKNPKCLTLSSGIFTWHWSNGKRFSRPKDTWKQNTESVQARVNCTEKNPGDSKSNVVPWHSPHVVRRPEVAIITI